jgi:hypothetical protein
VRSCWIASWNLGGAAAAGGGLGGGGWGSAAMLWKRKCGGEACHRFEWRVVEFIDSPTINRGICRPWIQRSSSLLTWPAHRDTASEANRRLMSKIMVKTLLFFRFWTLPQSPRLTPWDFLSHERLPNLGVPRGDVICNAPAPSHLRLSSKLPASFLASSPRSSFKGIFHRPYFLSICSTPTWKMLHAALDASGHAHLHTCYNSPTVSVLFCDDGVRWLTIPIFFLL